MPLSEKLNSGLDTFYENVLKQKDYAKQAAAQLDENGNRPPEVRLGRISSNGRVRLEFTNSMTFPSKEELIELNKQSNKLIDVFMVMGDEEVKESNLKSWEIASVKPNLIELDLVFAKPLHVSQGDENDKIIVQVGLARFPDEHQAKLPVSVNRVKDIPL